MVSCWPGFVEDINSEESTFVIQGPALTYTIDPNGLGHAVYNKMVQFSNHVAQIDGVTGIKDTYGQLLRRCISTAKELRKRGVTTDDIITICTANHLNSCVPLIAGLFLGIKSACLDPNLSAVDMTYLVKLVRPKIAFVSQESLQLVKESFGKAKLDVEIVTFGPSKHHTDFQEFVSSEWDENFDVYKCKDNKETALIYFSSGTSGLPKAVCISHYAMLSQMNTLSIYGFQMNVTLTFASLYWIIGGVFLFVCVHNGAAKIVIPKFDTHIFWKLIEEYKVTFVSISSRQVIALSKAGIPKGLNATHLSDIVTGGSTISIEHLQGIKKIVPETTVSLLYGQTEVCGWAFIFSPNKHGRIMINEKLGSSGTTNIGLECKIVDPETGKTLGANQQGEIRVKGATVMNGYYNMDASNAWDESGWLKTGDIAYYDEEGFFYIVDRIKEILKYQEFQISPAEIEDILTTHPSVAVAAVVGLPHDDGDLLLGLVELQDPADPVRVEDIQAHVELRVHDRQKLRGGLRIVNNLPITHSGKIKRNEITKLAREGKI